MRAVQSLKLHEVWAAPPDTAGKLSVLIAQLGYPEHHSRSAAGGHGVKEFVYNLYRPL